MLFDLHGVRVYEFDMYSIVGYNSIPNTIPLVTGAESTAFTEPTYGQVEHIGSPIWSEFKKQGASTYILEEIHDGCDDINSLRTSSISKFYASARAEDLPDFTPWDIFCRPELKKCCKDASSFLRPGRRQCVNGENLIVEFLAYARRFIDSKAAAGGHSFGFVNLMTAHEHFMTRLSTLDDHLPLFLKGLAPRLAKDTALIMLSDHGSHGIWYNDFGIGQAEHRNPALYMILPELLVEKYPAMDIALRRNTKRRVTPYDLHATLRHFSRWPELPLPMIHASSLAVELPDNRSCYDARIPPEYCLPLHSSCNNLEKVKVRIPAWDRL